MAMFASPYGPETAPFSTQDWEEAARNRAIADLIYQLQPRYPMRYQLDTDLRQGTRFTGKRVPQRNPMISDLLEALGYAPRQRSY